MDYLTATKAARKVEIKISKLCERYGKSADQRLRTPRRPKVIPDAAYPGMWRVQCPGGRLADMANLTRANDTAACFMETAERRQRGRQSPLEGRLCVKTNSLLCGNPSGTRHG